MSEAVANVIGAGPGGLATAMLLAKKGIKTRIFERKNKVGGRTSSIEAQGFKFDVGPTFFMFPRILEEVFEEAGMDLHREIEMKKLDPQYRLIYGRGGELWCTPEIEQMEQNIAALSPEDAKQLRPYLADNRRKLDAFTPVLQKPFNSVLSFLDPKLMKALPMLRPWNSVDRDLARFFKDERVRLAFTFQSKYLGMSPFKCPSLFSILSFLEYEHGVFHPIGGCAAVTEAMARGAERLGVEIRLGEEVSGLQFDGRRVKGLRTGSGEFGADATVINADFASAMERMVPDQMRRRWSDRKLAQKQYSCSTFMLYLGLNRRYDDLPHHSIFISSDYENNLDQIENQKVLPTDPSFYVQNPAVTDPTLAPEGKSGLYVLIPVPHKTANIDWEREKETFRRKTLDRLELAGFEGVEQAIEYEKMVTPADWEHDHHIYKGATFNLAHNFGQMLVNRPRNRFEELGGVYLVGGGIHPGSGLPVIFESARISASLLLRDLGGSGAREESGRELRVDEEAALADAV
ncbi:MAG: phytoene desaturase family protein [Verrucomicrobiota bacterium]